MIAEITEIPTSALWGLVTLMISAFVAHRLALSRDKRKNGNLGEAVLSIEETDLLVASSVEGRILIMRVDVYGEWVRADKTDFINTKDRAYAASYRQALDSLIARGLATSEGQSFALTGSGFAKARALKAAYAANKGTGQKG